MPIEAADYASFRNPPTASPHMARTSSFIPVEASAWRSSFCSWPGAIVSAHGSRMGIRSQQTRNSAKRLELYWAGMSTYDHPEVVNGEETGRESPSPS